MLRPLALLVSALVLGGCTRDPREVSLRLRPAEAIGCQPTAVRSVLLTPLGDLPAAAQPSLRLDLDGPSTIESFPPATEAVAVLAEGEIERVGGSIVPWTGGGIAVLDGIVRDELSVPLLMMRRSCSLSDTMGRAPPGAAVTTLPDGRLLVAGGERGESALALVTLGLGERLAVRTDVREASPRVGLSATPVGGDRVLLAGGARTLGSDARETYEVVSVDEGTILSDGILRGARRDHAAARLPDGRVLLVGGLDDAGVARADAELIEVSGDGGEADASFTAGAPSVARVGAELLVLDDGTVLLVGGIDASGEPVATIERFNPTMDLFETLDTTWAPRADSDYVPLIGGRVARVGGREGGVWSSAVGVLLDGGEVHVPLGAVLEAGYAAPRGVGLLDGRLLVVGADGAAVGAQIVDPGDSRTELEAALAPIEASRRAAHLERLADGTIAELDEDGLSLLRVDLASAFSDPAATINPAQVNQRAELSLDAEGRWAAVGDLLVAQAEGARFDLPSSRFANVSVELAAEGPLEVLLTLERASPIAVDVGERARFAGCDVPMDGTLRVEREGERLRLGSGAVSAECELPEGLGRVGVAVRAAAGSGVRRISVSRF